jgi:DNA-directed RNA polymerase specialized sigma24 family protein
VSPAADNELMLKVRDGDLGKLSFLFERYHRALFNFFLRSTGSRDLSEDLVQEVFLRILKYRHTFSARQPVFGLDVPRGTKCPDRPFPQTQARG